MRAGLIGLAMVVGAMPSATAAEDGAERIALAIVAFDASANTCVYDPAVGHTLQALDTFMSEQDPDLWADLKHQAQAAVPGMVNMGKLIGGASDCVTLGSAVGLGLNAAIAVGKLDLGLLQEIGRLTSGHGRRQDGGEPPPPPDPRCNPGSAAGMNRAYNRQHGIPNSGPPCPGDAEDRPPAPSPAE